MFPYTLRFWLFLLLWAYLLWKYRKNKLIALGTITLGLVALAFLLSSTRGVPDWVVGLVVAVFLILSIAVLISPIFFLARWFYRKVRPPLHEEAAQSPERRDRAS